MRITKYFRYVPKHFAVYKESAAVTVSASFAWGPERPDYTMAQPADHVTFNSITDNPMATNEKDVTAGTGLSHPYTRTRVLGAGICTQQRRQQSVSQRT